MKKVAILFLVTLSMVLAGCTQKEKTDETKKEEKTAEAPVLESIVIIGHEWGPSVDKVILGIDGTVETLSADSFEVVTKEVERTVTDVYYCNENGERSEKTEKQIALELKPDAVSKPMEMQVEKYIHNNWVKKYPVSVSLKTGKTLVIDGTEFSEIDCADENMIDRRICPETEKFIKSSYGEDVTLQTAAFEPETLVNDGKKNPLIIWLNGMGEGGTDVDIELLGNEVVALARDEIQQYFTTEGGESGIYVLAVQTPSYWMDNGDGQNHSGDQDSCYRELLMETIQNYVDTHEDVDKDRIYIGGCSNGGYMTVNMMIHYGDYFAAAYPICEAYQDSFITDEQIGELSKKNIWFIQAMQDGVVTPSKCGIPTYARLLKSGAQNCWYSMFENVVGQEDASVEYPISHDSWIYVLNDQVTGAQIPENIRDAADPAAAFVPNNEGGGTAAPQGYQNLFLWMNAQHRVEE